jgi:hypothetical protein
VKLSQVLLAHEEVISHALRNEVMSAREDAQNARTLGWTCPTETVTVSWQMHETRERKALAALDAIDEAEEEY